MGVSQETILITGGTGALGTALVDHCRNNDIPFVAPAHAELDITRADECEDFVKGKSIRGIIHAAAMVDWVKVHEQPERALAVNCNGTLIISRLAKKVGAPLVYVSTDAVFPGTSRENGYREDEAPSNPVSLYGMTKLMGEWACSLDYDQTAIARLGWLFGSTPTQDQKFVGLMVRQIAAGKRDLKAVNDKYGSPTYAPHAAAKLVEFVEQGTVGTRHVVNEGVASRYDVAAEVVKLWGDPQTTVEPISSDFFPSIVKRPDYAGLSTIYEDAQLPMWQDALAEYHDHFPALSDFAAV